MPSPTTRSARAGAAFAAFVSIALVATAHLLFGDWNLDIGDEGFLWYGVLRTAAGEVPLRDFQSYEPGRYYWGALWSLGLGKGILALRLSCRIFQALGLFCGLLVARRFVTHPAWLLPVGLVLALWMFPQHKLFESSLSMMAVYVGLRLLETHSRLGLFGVGTFVGFASFFGRNHALYAGLGILLLALWLHWKRREDRFFTRFATLGGGVLVGCFPLMGMMLWVPGFGESFLESVRFTLEHDANLPVPVPWPWQTDYTALSWQERTGSFALGSTFALAPLVYGLGLLTMLRTRTEQLQQRSALIAATAVGVFYLHHASVRSDALHLAQCVHPLLLAGLAIPAAFDLLRGRLPTLAIWSGIALLTVSFVPNYDATFPLRFQPRVTMVTQRIMGDELRLAWPRAKYLASIKEIVRRRVPEDETILIAPHMAALYPLLRKTSPVWGLAFLWEADAQGEGEIIRDLERKRVNWALVLDIPIDGRDELRFSQSHRRVWEYLTREFVRIEDPALPGMHVLFRRRPPGPGAEPW